MDSNTVLSTLQSYYKRSFVFSSSSTLPVAFHFLLLGAGFSVQVLSYSKKAAFTKKKKLTFMSF